MKRSVLIAGVLTVIGVAGAVRFGAARSSAASSSSGSVGIWSTTSFVPGKSVDVGALYVRQTGSDRVAIASIRFSCTGCVTRLVEDLHKTRGIEGWRPLHASPPAFSVRFDPRAINATQVAERARDSLESDSFNHSPVAIVTVH